MFGRLGALLALLFCLWALLVQPTSSSPTLAAEVVGTELPNRSVELGPPPALSHTCGGAATPIDYDQPVCCANGYVYLDSEPVGGATVTISANGENVTVETEQGGDEHGRVPDHHPAHFGLSLSEEPLNIQPGDEVTITVESDGIIKQRTFIAEPGAQRQDMVLPPSGNVSRRADHVMAFDGQHVILFGGLDEYSRSNDTWKWLDEKWAIVTPTLSPPSRYKHAMAYDSVRDRIVLFGGYQSSDSRFDDTWEWDGSTWKQGFPSSDSPQGRTSHAMAYDVTRGQIVLFGGYDGTYRGDTWVWDGDDWEQKSPPSSPSGRANHAMAYDTATGKLILFGGYDGNTHLSDTWSWDGETWTEESLAADASPSARYQHTMEYDSANGQVVLFGGIDFNNTALNDTWVWNDTTWIKRQPQKLPPARREHAWAYDATRQRIVLFGGYAPTRLGDTWEWDGNNWEHRDSGGEVPPPVDALPIATISHINPRDAQQGNDEIIFRGHGGDADRTDIIQKYEWRLDGEQIISTEANFTLTAYELYDFSVGTHTISFKVQDDEGTWSEATQEEILIRGDDGDTGTEGTWTHLIYAVGDNELDHWMGDNGMLHRLRFAGAQDNVQVGILYDGPQIGDTLLYILAEDGTWTEESWHESETRMDDMKILRDFIKWGYERFTSDYYALSLLDHANGLVGFGQDKSTDQNGHAFLTPLELREALRQATNGRKIEILHYDGCSFGLLEDAAIARGFAQYVVASPNTGWGVFSYETYRQKAGNLLAPESYARAIAQEYASSVENIEDSDYAYTISVFDMAHFEDVNSAVSILGNTLLTYVNGDQGTRITQVEEIRDASQKYDSGGETTIEIDNEDSYVDIVDFASKLQEQIDDQNVYDDAAAVKSMIEEMMIYEKHKSGPFDYQGIEYAASLSNAHGLGIFYPPHSSGSAYDNYINNLLFDTTANSGWTDFLEEGIPKGGDSQGLPDDELLPPLGPSGGSIEYQLFLPSVLR